MSIVKLGISIIMDLIGMSASTVPVVGDVADVLFAPLTGLWIYFAYDNIGMGLLGVAEELGPGITDIVPSCTIAHVMHYLKKPKKNY